VLDCFELTDGCFLGITTDNASSNYLMSGELQSTLEASGFEWTALRNHIPCMANFIQMALGAVMSSFGVKSCTKLCEVHQRDQQCGENDSIDIGKSQRLRNEANATITQLLAMQPGLLKIIEKVCISFYLKVLKLTFI